RAKAVGLIGRLLLRLLRLSLGGVGALAALLIDLVEIVDAIALLLLLLLQLLLLRQRGGDDPVVVLGVLEIVLRHDPVACAHGISGKRGILLRHLLGGAADFHIRAVAFVAARQGVWSLAVVVPATSAHASVLLLRPHPILFSGRCKFMETRVTATRLAVLSRPVARGTAACRHSCAVHMLAGRSPHEAGRRSRKRGSLFNGNRIENRTACFVSSGCRNVAALPKLAKFFLHLRQGGREGLILL